ncbi:hypothetical protein [Sulfuritalea sp.]|uniref:hypothetical protein n=1 Tax=Sulfuritalea sp. TaxID=2480090 RepID=UPI00286E1B0F|nr:hypothetical protein [Sulfuritalea sp.]
MSDLIRLGLAFVVLDVDPRIAHPRRLEDGVTGASPVSLWRGFPKYASQSFLRSPNRTLLGSRRIWSRILVEDAMNQWYQ